MSSRGPALAQAPARATYWHPWVVASLALLGGIVRFGTLDVQSFWLDEAVTVEVIRGSLGHVLDGVVESESTPHLYYVLAWAWGNVFGVGEVGLRSLSALFGVLTIPVVYLAGARLVDRSSGVAAAAVVAFNPLAIHYSQEARAYGLLILASAVTLVGFAALYRETEQQTWPPLVLWSAGSCLALVSHYFAVFLIAAEAAVLFWTRPRQRRRVVAGLVPVGVAGLLLAPIAVEQRAHGFADWISAESIATRSLQVPKQFLVGLDGPAEKLTTLLTGILVLGALWLLIRRSDRNRQKGAAAAGAVGIIAALLPFLLAVAGVDYFNGRNVLAALVPFALVVGAGWAVSTRLGVALLATYAVISLAIFGIVQTDVRYQRDNWRGAANEVDQNDEPRAIIVSPYDGRIPLRLYLPSALELSGRGSKAREIVYLGMGERSPGGAASAPLPTTLEPPLPGFRLVQQRRARTYTILRFRSRTAQAIRPNIAGEPRFRGGSRAEAILVDPGG